MAIITTPGAGVSPYETTTTTPTVLRASADGSTVSTSAAAAAATVSELAATNANILVVVSGQAALNSLITSNQPGVFEGANVTINLEEQNFNTTNQVTSTINSPSGNTGEIQYNSGANSFASDPYFTYTNSNVITPGIRTNNYLYANGAPFLAGGNAAIGNFVFTGDNMTISHANSTLNINGNGTGNIDVTANGNTWTFGNNRILTLPGGPRIVPVGANLELQAASGGYAEIVTSDGNNYVAVTGSGAQIVTSGINTWTFDNVGNLILPGNTFAVKYANGDTVAISSGGFPLANGTSNIDIATANGNVTVTANGSPTWTFAADGNLTFPSNAQITVDGTGAAVFQHEGGVTIAETNGNSLVYNTVIELFDNAIHLGTDQQGNAYSWDLSQDGSMTVPGNITGANVVSANVYTAISNVSITSSGNTWTFNTDGNLTLPAAGNIVGAANIIGNGAGNVNVNANSRTWTFAADGSLVLPLAGNIVNYGNTWTFGYDGNLTLPGNIIAINYANGNRVTGNITFRDEIVIGTGTSNLISGLYLAPSSSSADASMYLRVRGNIVDEPTHIHFDTGNNAYYNQFIGDDNKYIQLANTGNIVINSNDGVGNAAQWNFDTTGNLKFPTGNLVIIPDYAAESNAAIISSTDHILGLLSTGVNGGVQSVWVEDVANIGTSNIAALRVSPISQIGNVQIQTGNNSSINTWTFTPTGVLTAPGNITFLGDASSAPWLNNFNISAVNINATAGNLAVANGGAGGASGGYISATRDISATGNITANNGMFTNIVNVASFTGGLVSVTGNITGGNVLSGIVSGTGNITGGNILTGGLISATANITGGNLLTGGLISATGNITGGNILTGGLISVTGNISGGNLIVTGIVVDTTANLDLQTTAANGNINLITAGTGIVATAASFSATGNVSAGNLNVTGNIVDTGALTIITGSNGNIALAPNGTGNVTTGANVSVTGNITGGNLSVTGNVTGNTAGFTIGYLNVPQVSFSGNATIAATDAGKHYYSVLSTANVLTIANNTSVTWAVGTAISLVNRGTGNITVAQGTGVSLYLAGNATSGNRTVATYGMATLLNVAANIWMINGTGVT